MKHYVEKLLKKKLSLNSSRRESQKAQAIMELRHKFDLNLLLNQTNMARSNFYYHQKRNQPINIK
jgi:hypothetical protein